ncbi:hypothetical protein Purlil1_9113 [Purpureocillium lilacinum]|uniref:Uncharacterized protein n=1 Tax=Purpureocillium lilacinum TaxID=33203 RepID=A0ABR0BRA4_PURLI|nr:hypothetical protein Purlil1_9113 [Purpureocillium lilacinum]
MYRYQGGALPSGRPEGDLHHEGSREYRGTLPPQLAARQPEFPAPANSSPRDQNPQAATTTLTLPCHPGLGAIQPSPARPQPSASARAMDARIERRVPSLSSSTTTYPHPRRTAPAHRSLPAPPLLDGGATPGSPSLDTPAAAQHLTACRRRSTAWAGRLALAQTGNRPVTVWRLDAVREAAMIRAGPAARCAPCEALPSARLVYVRSSAALPASVGGGTRRTGHECDIIGRPFIGHFIVRPSVAQSPPSLRASTDCYLGGYHRPTIGCPSIQSTYIHLIHGHTWHTSVPPAVHGINISRETQVMQDPPCREA